MDTTNVDEEAAQAFAGRLFEMFTGGALTYLVHIGHTTGLFAATAAGPAAPAALAARAGLRERYVREWLAAMACAQVVEYDAGTGTFWLPREHAASLTGDGVANLAPVALLTTLLGRHVDGVANAFRTGGGVPWAAFLPDIHPVMDALWQPMYQDLLVPEILPLAPGLVQRLRGGVRVAEVACGSGNALVLLGAEFPASTFVGIDIDRAGIERGRGAAAERGLSNVTLRVADAALIDDEESFDAVLVFNAIHDQAAPDAVLRNIHRALRPGGTFLMDEPRISSVLADNIDNPVAAFTYAVSVLHCLTVSLAVGGAGLGTGWGEQVARRMLADAGFADVVVHDAPGDPGNAVFVATR